MRIFPDRVMRSQTRQVESRVQVIMNGDDVGVNKA